jgi:hypothetical protein
MRLIKSYITLLLLAGILIAQDFQGVKIYINPGHGGHDPANDRYIEATGFWESEGNLTKGLYLRDLLEAHNAQVFMSRTRNREEDDLPLSQIDADANANDVDYFHSIHSNAFKATVNYPLLLFRGYDNDPVFSDAKRMGNIMWTEMDRLDNQWTDWPYSWVNNRGDWDFYSQWGTSGLGVLRTLKMPGTLSEGSFHDYVPNSWRLMSIDYRKHESIVILRSFIEYYDLDPLDTGVIAGIVRDKNNNVTYNYNYNSGLPNDRKRTVNNARVTLLPDNKIYNVDFNNNGFYMFENLEPGEYQVVMEGGRYQTDTVSVTAVASRTAFANSFLVSDGSKPPQVYAHTPVMSATDVPTHADIEVLFSQKMRRGTTEDAFSIDPEVNGIFIWQEDEYKLVFSLIDTLARSKEYHINITTDAENNLGVNMEEAYQFSFTSSATHVAPEIIEVIPADQTDSVFIYKDISITFDVPMKITETQNAFHIEPATDGVFAWNDDSTVMTFSASNGLERKTNYLVTIDETAENSYGVGMESTFQFAFNTRQRNEVNLVESFPSDGAEEISPNLQFYAVFNGLISTGTVLENLELQDASGNTVAFRGLDVFSKNGKGVIVLEPRIELTKNSQYTLYFYPGIKDMEGLAVLDTIAITFKTELRPYASGTVVDDFEINFGWVDPDTDPVTSGTDDEKTTFSLSAFKEISGTYAGKLEYTFVSYSGGICRLKNQEGLKITSESSSEFGIWIFGDFSHNLLEYWFDYQGTTDAAVVIDTIDWAGWKMVTLPVSQIEGSGDIYFQSLVIRQLEEADTSGTLYIDDIQYDIIYTDIEEDLFFESKPVTFELFQNYPNPFNPSTKIRYQIPKASDIDLSIYNILGQKIETLVSGSQAPGIYEYEWNAENFASGVYFYRLETDEGIVQTRKLVLMK